MNAALVWVSYAKDLEWFRYSLASYRRFATGFDDAVVLIPEQDRELFEQACEGSGVRTEAFLDWPGIGFNRHMAIKTSADLFTDAKLIFHIDSDTVFTMPVTPECWMHESGKPVALYQLFSSFENEFGPKMWKSRVDAAIGGSVLRMMMVTPPYIHYRDVYAATREAVERQHCDKTFLEYVKSCENTFPQGYAEFPTLGALAQRAPFAEDYHWHNIIAEGNPAKLLVGEGWSHGGLDYVVSDRFDGKLTARQYFASLGL